MALKLDRRGHGRKPVNILATLTCGKDIHSCHVVEISEAGARVRLASEFAMVEGKAKLAAAEIGAHDAEVRWQRGQLVGLQFTAVKKRATGVPGAPRI